jgi:hypothetical protein
LKTGRKSVSEKSGSVKKNENRKADARQLAHPVKEPASTDSEITTIPDTHDKQGNDDNTGSKPQGSAGRPFWSGSITIGLVNVPVHLHTMVRDKSFSFRLSPPG